MNTTEHLTRSVATGAHNAWTRWAAMPTTHPEHDATLTAAMYGHGVAHLLRALAEHAPDQADAIARDLRKTWDDGGAIGDDLHQWTRPPVNTCVTCDRPEAAWDQFDPLFIAGAAMCPDCSRHDLNEEATRNHAEVNA